MKNIHVLPTEKPSRLYLGNLGKPVTIQSASAQFKKPLHIYITSDEEIKEGDWCLNEDDFDKHLLFKADSLFFDTGLEAKKIILTTDQDLIKDGVQAIDDEFFEWFVSKANDSGKPIDIVEVDYRYDANLQPILDSFGNKVLRIKIPTESSNLSQIIIPKEEHKTEIDYSGFPKSTQGKVNYVEPKQEKDYTALLQSVGTKQETIEEMAYRLFSTMPSEISTSTAKSKALELAKWQQEQDKKMYSEEELLEFANWCRIHDNKHPNRVITIQQLFEQFKNK
jgi:hypothetical protein